MLDWTSAATSNATETTTEHGNHVPASTGTASSSSLCLHDDREDDEVSERRNYNTYQHPLFFLFNARKGSQASQHQRGTSCYDEDTWMMVDDDDVTPSTTPVLTPGLTTTTNSRTDRASTFQRCCCTSCQSCLPSCFEDVNAEEEEGEKKAGSFFDLYGPRQATTVLQFQLRREDARWRPALARYRCLSSAMVVPCGTAASSVGFGSLGDSMAPLLSSDAAAGNAADVANQVADGSETESSSTSAQRPGTAAVAGATTTMAAGTMMEDGAQPGPRFGHTAVLFDQNRTMVVFGGKNSSRYLNDVHYYDVAQGRWTRQLNQPDGAGAPWPSPRSGHTASAYKDFMYVLSGGVNDQSGCADDLWRLHTESGVWAKECQRLPFSPRKGHSMHLLPAANTSGRASVDMLVVFGGLVRVSSHHPRPGDPESARAIFAANAAAARPEAVCAPTNDVWMYQLGLGRWALLKTSGEPPAPRFYHVSQMVEGTTVLLIFGGRTTASGSGTATAATILSPATVNEGGAAGSGAESESAGSPTQTETVVASGIVSPTRSVDLGTTASAPPPAAVGTTSSCFNDLYQLEISTGVWRSIKGVHGDIPSPRTCSASIFANGVFAVFAGGNAEFCDSNYEFHLGTRRWRRLSIKNGPACSRPTVVFTGSRLVLYGGCAGTRKVLGRGRNGVLELPLAHVSLRDSCDLWIRRVAFQEAFLASGKRTRPAAAPSAISGDWEPRLPSQNFARCWSCSPSTSTAVMTCPPSMRQSPTLRPSGGGFPSGRGSVGLPVTAPTAAALSNPPSATLRARAPPGMQLRLTTSPRPFSPHIVAGASERAMMPPMSPTEPLPGSVATAAAAAAASGGFNAPPAQLRSCFPQPTHRPERVLSPLQQTPRERSAGTSPTTVVAVTHAVGADEPVGPIGSGRLGYSQGQPLPYPRQQSMPQPAFPRFPVYQQHQAQHRGPPAPNAREVGSTSPPAPSPAAKLASPGLRVWIPPYSSPRPSYPASPRSLGGSTTTLSARTAGGFAAQAPQPRSQQQAAGGSQQTSPVVRPGVSPTVQQPQQLQQHQPGAVRRPSPSTAQAQAPTEVCSRRYVPAVRMDSSRSSGPGSPVYRDAAAPGFGNSGWASPLPPPYQESSVPAAASQPIRIDSVRTSSENVRCDVSGSFSSDHFHQRKSSLCEQDAASPPSRAAPGAATPMYALLEGLRGENGPFLLQRLVKHLSCGGFSSDVVRGDVSEALL